MDNIIPLWLGLVHEGSQQVLLESGCSSLTVWVKAEQNDVVGPLTVGASCKVCAGTQ